MEKIETEKKLMNRKKMLQNRLQNGLPIPFPYQRNSIHAHSRLRTVNTHISI